MNDASSSPSERSGPDANDGCPSVGPFTMRSADNADHAFLVEMARMASIVEGRHPLPPGDSDEVLEILPRAGDVALVAVDRRQRHLGATWCFTGAPPLVKGDDAPPLPELATAVLPWARGRGVATALIEALAARMSTDTEALTLNVHLLNPAIHLYVKTGFRVIGQGRGPYGVAMIRDLKH